MTQVDAPGKREAFYCWGLIHARERGRQMQVLRQTGRGRLAEERGPEFLKGDFTLRLMELEPRAARVTSQIPTDDRLLLDAYASGVNDGNSAIFSADRWKAADTVLLLLLQSFDQTRRSFEQDILTDQYAREGHPLQRDFPWDTPILKKGEYPERGGSSHAGGARSRVFPFAPEDDATGSNNWVVSGRHTRSGKPLLANDPHLQLKSPPFWHWMQISWPGVRLIGAGVPGVPLIASGASSHLAWGLTNSYVDVSDAVLVPRADLRTRTIRPVVWVKKWGVKWPVFFKTFEAVEDANLPVLPIESPESGHAVVLRSTVFDVTASDLSALWRLPEAKTVGELDEALSQVGLPSWNFVFADTKGGIGYRAVGRLPKREWREPGKMEVVAASALGSFAVLSREEAPHALNPARGWIATANQLQWGAEGRYSVGTNHTESFRGFRVEELLKQGLGAKHSVGSFRGIQCDQQAVDARFLLPVLLRGLPRSAVTDRLARWNFEAGVDCRECALFRLWMKELGDPQWTYARAREGSPQFRAEAADALERAYSRLSRLPGGPWVRWGSVHRAGFPVTEALRPFGVARAEALETFGDDHSVSPGSSDSIDDGNGGILFSQHSGASQRLIVELSDPPRVHWVLPGANHLSSGVLEDEPPRSPSREAWAACRLEPLSWGETGGRDRGGR